ncbi:MAG: hypothetical protein AAFO94_14150, partial [Bacteroidota bacterium]
RISVHLASQTQKDTMRFNLLLVLSFLLTSGLVAQDESLERSNDGVMILFNGGLAGQLPGGDLGERFGRSLSLGGSLELMTKSNWIFGLVTKYIWQRG